MADAPPSTPNHPIQRDEKETTTHILTENSNPIFEDVSPVTVLPQRPRPLNQRIPKTSDVLKIISADHGFNTMVKHFDLDEEDIDNLLREDYWEKVTEQIVALLDKFAAQNTRAVKKMQQNYTTAISELQNTFIFYLNPYEDQRKLTQSIGFKYIEAFHRLLRSLRDGEVGVDEQIQNIVIKLQYQSPQLMFDDNRVAENTYYVIGFLGFQLMKQAGRRKKGSAVRLILEHICTNKFITPSTTKNKEEILKMRESGIPTGLIDRRVSMGKLQYPDQQCWRVFATVETIYNSLVRLDNFVVSGGTLLNEVCYGILQNDIMMELFASLLEKDNQFGTGAIAEAFKLFLDVFAHVRARDVAAKMNAVDYKESTVSTRPTLAGLSKTKKDTTTTEETKLQAPASEDINEHNEILGELEHFDAEEESDLDAFKICTYQDDENSDC
jgi:hypothetical protein